MKLLAVYIHIIYRHQSHSAYRSLCLFALPPSLAESIATLLVFDPNPQHRIPNAPANNDVHINRARSPVHDCLLP